MESEVTLHEHEAGDPEAVEAVETVGAQAKARDRADAFDEQARLELACGRRHALVAVGRDGTPVAAAVLSDDHLDLAVVPDRRRNGIAGALVDAALPTLATPTTAWAHGDHAGARALANRYRFEPVRTLLRLRVDLTRRPAAEADTGHGVTIDHYRPGPDDADWVALNARIFADHPEQGAVGHEGLAERRAEPWFDPDDFLIARDADGTMVGYDWLKVEPGGEAEIYVLGVAPEAAGHGLGRRLLAAGLDRLAEAGRSSAVLYVEGDNDAAVHLYRSAGFVDDQVDVHYRRG